jgi:hypothetical protein
MIFFRSAGGLGLAAGVLWVIGAAAWRPWLPEQWEPQPPGRGKGESGG